MNELRRTSSIRAAMRIEETTAFLAEETFADFRREKL